MREIVFLRSAERDLVRLPASDQQRILDALSRYAETGYGDIKRLTGHKPPQYPLRAGDIRLRFLNGPGQPPEIVILRIFRRDKAHRS